MGLTELDIKKVIVKGDVKYEIYGEIFDTFKEAQEFIESFNNTKEKTDKTHNDPLAEIVIDERVAVMSGEELRAAADEIMREQQVKTAKAVGLKL